MDTLVERGIARQFVQRVRTQHPEEVRRPVLVVERFPLVRRALTSVLDSAEGLMVAGGAGSVRKAWELYRGLRPALVVTDWTLDERGDGGEFGRSLKGLPDPPQVLLYSSSNGLDVLVACLSGAADSFVYREADTDQLLEAIASMDCGSPSWYLGGHGQIPTDPAGREQGSDIAAAQLTARERQVLELVVRRYSNAEIADELYLAHQTVKNYVSTILQKLDVSSRRELFAPPLRSTAPNNGPNPGPSPGEMPAALLGRGPSAPQSPSPSAAPQSDDYCACR